jgi:hypothetical protein
LTFLWISILNCKAERSSANYVGEEFGKFLSYSDITKSMEKIPDVQLGNPFVVATIKSFEIEN